MKMPLEEARRVLQLTSKPDSLRDLIEAYSTLIDSADEQKLKLYQTAYEVLRDSNDYADRAGSSKRHTSDSQQSSRSPPRSRTGDPQPPPPSQGYASSAPGAGRYTSTAQRKKMYEERIEKGVQTGWKQPESCTKDEARKALNVLQTQMNALSMKAVLVEARLSFLDDGETLTDVDIADVVAYKIAQAKQQYYTSVLRHR